MSDALRGLSDECIADLFSVLDGWSDCVGVPEHQTFVKCQHAAPQNLNFIMGSNAPIAEIRVIERVIKLDPISVSGIRILAGKCSSCAKVYMRKI